ncbi:hypothetical protein ENH_00071100 [Eimeria necatrix]|uniref:PARG catalytic Macro domain-containing protein n=1 Tax=Eimeria necatrix TaxID=51315 RepID=U6MSC1_9EIME|nr:hypothetical protein ENH_00071100 [Eimeria necatrix]CDJ64525.1 hypothetical protein ENH_00071100 [Eimeria necatrix]
MVRNPNSQFQENKMKREVLKALLGFQGDPFEALLGEPKAPVATGKWGCVIFGGDNELKTLLQWIAASAAGRTLVYMAFGDKSLSGMQQTLNQIKEKFKTTADLFAAVLQVVALRGSFPRYSRQWSLWRELLRL